MTDKQGTEIYSHHGVLWRSNVQKGYDDQSPGTLSIVEYETNKCIEWKPSDLTVDSEINDQEWTVVNTAEKTKSGPGNTDTNNRSRLFQLPLSDLQSFRICKHGQQIILTQNGLPNTFFFHNGNADCFVAALQGNVKTCVCRRDKHLFKVLNDTSITQSFAELDLFPESKSDCMWKFVKDFPSSPYETTMTAFSKLTDAWLYGHAAETKRVQEVAELITQRWTPAISVTKVASEEYEVISGMPSLPSRCSVTRGDPLTPDQWVEFQDEEGRIADVEGIKNIIFKGGISPFIRSEVWKFLLDYFPWDSTNTDRQNLRKKKADEYYRMKLQWKTITQGQEERFSDYRDRKSLIEKDVKRTDRSIHYFAGDNNPNLSILSDILKTYVMYNFDLGYVQGMSDLLSPILCLMENECDAFWCFVGFMSRVQRNFDLDQSGMKTQLNELQLLLNIVDGNLSSYIHLHDSGNMFFCFRWLLVLFKREFSQSDIMKLWEVLWTNLPCDNFHLLICAAILDMEKTVIMERNYGFTEILKHINDLSMKIDLTKTLCTAETIFNQLNSAPQLPDSIRKILGLQLVGESEVQNKDEYVSQEISQDEIVVKTEDEEDKSESAVTLCAGQNEVSYECSLGLNYL